jgi:uncharacterized protein YdiU (UPF0061 family)
MHWNLTRLAEAMLPVLAQEEGSDELAVVSANEALAAYSSKFEIARSSGLRRKLGLFTEHEGDAALAEDLLQRMAVNGADFTLTFRLLCNAATEPQGDAKVRALFADATAYDSWVAEWRERLTRERMTGQERATAMRRENPAYIPRNHMVEAALNTAIARQDFRPFEELLDAVTRPFEDRAGLERYGTPARPEECVSHTFCGT